MAMNISGGADRAIRWRLSSFRLQHLTNINAGITVTIPPAGEIDLIDPFYLMLGTGGSNYTAPGFLMDSWLFMDQGATLNFQVRNAGGTWRTWITAAPAASTFTSYEGRRPPGSYLRVQLTNNGAVATTVVQFEIHLRQN